MNSDIARTTFRGEGNYGCIPDKGWALSTVKKIEFQTTSSSSFEFEFELARSPPKIFFHVELRDSTLFPRRVA